MNKEELVDFMQWLSYFGAEAALTVNGQPISKPQAEILADAYLKQVSK